MNQSKAHSTKLKRLSPKGIAIEIAGWILVAAGLAALILPGPGLLGIFAGLALLATRYEWAERRLHPVRKKALDTARQSVADNWTMFGSILGAGLLIAAGIFWGVGPDAPGWWPLEGKYWLAGGWGTGATIIASGILALGMVGYSYKRFRTTA